MLMPIMVSVEVYAMRFATGPGLCRGLSFWVEVGGYHFWSGKKIGVGNMAFLRDRVWQK